MQGAMRNAAKKILNLQKSADKADLYKQTIKKQ